MTTLATRGDHRVRHPQPVEGCFGCKARTIRLANWTTSDRGRRQLLNGFATELELTRYLEARRQGIQPRGTRLDAIEEAERESRRLDRPYNAADPVPLGEVIEA